MPRQAWGWGLCKQMRKREIKRTRRLKKWACYCQWVLEDEPPASSCWGSIAS